MMNQKDEIRKELQEIAPFLAGLEIKSAFKVPKGYFEELPDTIFESVSPLAGLKKEQVFNVPKNYFESLPDLVLERVSPKRDTEVVAEPEPVNSSPQSSWIDDLINNIALLFQPRYVLRVATVAILLTAGFFFMQNNKDNAEIAGTTLPPSQNLDFNLDDLSDEDMALLEMDDLLDEDQLLDEMLEDLNDLSDEDLEGLL